jgi:hypothetical protein
MAEIGIARKRHCRGRPRVRPDGETRRALQEADKSSDGSGTSYASAVRRTAVALADRLRVQRARGLTALDDVDEAAGMLLGMVASAARRHLRRPASAVAFATEARVRTCAAPFLRGCEVQGIQGIRSR